jgi:hypothetical protein
MNKSRLEGSIDDFVFTKSLIKVILPLKKVERGTHTKLITVHRAGKTFKRKQRVGRKEKDEVSTPKREIKEIKKSSLHPDNLIEISDINETIVVDLIGGIHEDETYICQFKDGSKAIHKTMMLGDITGEVGTYETAKIIGWDIVPETIKCDYGKGDGSTQKWISNSNEPYDGFDDNAILIEEKHLDDLSKIFVMDMIMGNFDRHSRNIIIDENDKCWAIDNEMIGKLNNSQLHMESLSEWAKTGAGSFVPMISVLKDSFGDDTEMYKKFKDHVDKNINQVIQNKDEIIKYWSQYKDSKMTNTSIPIKESIKNIGSNIKYLENYQNMETNK